MLNACGLEIEINIYTHFCVGGLGCFCKVNWLVMSMENKSYVIMACDTTKDRNEHEIKLVVDHLRSSRGGDILSAGDTLLLLGVLHKVPHPSKSVTHDNCEIHSLILILLVLVVYIWIFCQRIVMLITIGMF